MERKEHHEGAQRVRVGTDTVTGITGQLIRTSTVFTVGPALKNCTILLIILRTILTQAMRGTPSESQRKERQYILLQLSPGRESDITEEAFEKAFEG